MILVQGLNEDKKNLGEISYEGSTTPILSVKDYQTFGSRRTIIENIIKALDDAEVPAIGVWGMGGVGKSTLMKEVMRLAKEKNLFEDVAMAVVTQNPDVKKIQGELAVWLGLKFTNDDSTVSGRASRLHKRLNPTDKKKSTGEPMETKKQKQVLVILDDIWRGLDLEEIGIPVDGGAVKLLLTSRKQHVLSSEMSCSRNVFKLEVLMDEELWRLFESIVGEIATRDSRFKSIGEQVVKKCSGLPIVLKAIAATLKNCSLPEWEDALVQSKGSKDAYSNLEISYRHLESDELKSLFLMFGLTHRVFTSLQDLLYYCIGLGLLTGTKTVRSARHKLKALLHNLQDSSLLLKDNDQEPDDVHIHDVVREVAIRIASRDQHSILITDEFKLKEIPRKNLKKSKAISIPFVKFRKLPEGWECPELKMFLLYRKDDDPPIGISNSFFQGMKELSVLDMSGRCFDSFPSSFKLLLNLYTLCLDSCSIADLTIIGKLKQLQILTFRGSEIARLPKEIGELSELKVLNLAYSKLKVIEPQVLGKLTSLEELHLQGSSFIRWEDEGETQPKNAKLSELNNLSKLSTANILIHNPDTIPKHLEFGNLAEYIIQIGDIWGWNGDYKESRILKIKLELCRSNFLHEKWVQDLLKRSQNLHLDGIKGWLIRSMDELCLDGFQELKHLHLQNSSSVQFVARSVSKWSPCTTFTVLESLFLEKLGGLEMIIRGPITAKSFSKLKVIKVIKCGKLKSLFSYSMLKGFSQLEEIEVRDCEAMQVIVTVDSVATNTEAVKLQALHRFKLHNLPNFMRFCSSHRAEIDQTEVKSRSSEIVQEDRCITTGYTMFSNDQLISFPLVKSLILSKLPKLKHIWQYNYCPIEVANLECLEVRSCDELLIVIPSSLVKEVTKLQTLIVRDCGSLQELFETSDGDTLNLTSNVEILSRLNNLELSNLPFLRHIWENNHPLEKVRAFQNLNLLKVVNCSSLTNLLPAVLLKSLNQLIKLRIENCKEMKAVIQPEHDGRNGETKNIVFESLSDVWLEDLPNMVTFVWTKGGESINFLSLKELYVKECPKMRSFSLLKEDENAHDELCFFNNKVLLPKLEMLYLISLRSIRKIWHEETLEESFCQLEILVVEGCQTLVDVIPSINMTTKGISRLQFHNLKEMKIIRCSSLEEPLFKFAEVTGNCHYYSLSRLEKLWLFQLPKLEHVVQPDSHVVVEFPSLVDISVADCQCLIDVFPIATATTLSKLQDLQISRCSSMRQIFGKGEEEEDDEMVDSILFPRLHSIVVRNMDSLISFFAGTSCMLGFPSLETLKIFRCSKLKTFVQRHTNGSEPSPPFTKQIVHHHYLFDDKVEFPNLKKMDLWELSTLQTVLKTKLPCLNICDRIRQITELTIKNCESLEEFIFESDEKSAGGEEIKTTTPDPAIFHSLANVTLENLPKMVAFIRGRRRDQSNNFLSLKELYIRKCPKMRTFYLAQNTEESGGESLVPVCSLFDHKIEFRNLQKMILFRLSSLKTIWKKDEMLPSSDSLSRLKSLTVSECKDLQHICPASFASNLVQLEELSIDSCRSLEEIVMHGDDFGISEELDGINSSNQTLFFPQLTSIVLYDLPKLRSFFHCSNASTWSALKRLWVWHCDKVQIFTTKHSSSSSENSSTRQSLFSAEQVIPKLEILRLVEEDVIMIQDGEFKEDIFTELKHFSLACFHNESAAGFPLRFLLENKFHKLERLNVFCNSFEEIFGDESLTPLEIIAYKERFAFAGDGSEKPLARLTEIKLSELDKLKHVWRADMTVFAEILKSIQHLELWDCPNLNSLFRTASCSFGNITIIKVTRCSGMQELLAISAATSLVKLTQLDIYDCGMIETIVSPDDCEGSKTEEENCELLVICFRELKHIGFHRLSSLKSFSSANCNFELPSLQEVIVIGCPNLKVFSTNSVVAPKLSKVRLTEKKLTGNVRWDGDLNTTIQNLLK